MALFAVRIAPCFSCQGLATNKSNDPTMNWMTSAKKRVYKTKRQREQQKRISAQYKIGDVSGRLGYNPRLTKDKNLGQAIQLYLRRNDSHNIDLKFLRNLHREKQIEANDVVPMTISNSLHHNNNHNGDYDPMDDLVSSPLHSENELTHDVDSVFRSLENDDHGKEEINSVKSRQSILYINNDQHTTYPTSEFRFDSDIDCPFSNQQHPEPIIVEPEVPKNKISRTWDLFEGKGIENIFHKDHKNGRRSKIENDRLLSSSIDIDDAFEVDDFLLP